MLISDYHILIKNRGRRAIK